MKHANTPEQDAVVSARVADGYALLGVSNSRTVQGYVYVLVKKKHCVAINCLGYDEHTSGATWRIVEDE